MMISTATYGTPWKQSVQVLSHFGLIVGLPDFSAHLLILPSQKHKRQKGGDYGFVFFVKSFRTCIEMMVSIWQGLCSLIYSQECQWFFMQTWKQKLSQFFSNTKMLSPDLCPQRKCTRLSRCNCPMPASLAPCNIQDIRYCPCLVSTMPANIILNQNVVSTGCECSRSSCQNVRY